MIFETMLETARSALAKEIPAPGAEMPPQATVLLPDKGNLHVIVCRNICDSDCDDVNKLLTALKAKGETKILKMVTMWKNDIVDISSMYFRKSIYEINKENLETEVLLSAKGPHELPHEYVVKKLKTLTVL